VQARWYCSIVNFQLYLTLILLFHLLCRQNGTTLLPIFQLHFALIPLLSVLGFLPVADDSGKTISSIWKSSDFASF
jgi:hypothetical protein